MGESQNVCFKKTKHPKFSEKRLFLPLDTHPYECVSGGKKCSFSRKFGVLCFLETPVLRRPFSFFRACYTYQYLIRKVYLKSWHKVQPDIFSLKCFQMILTHFSLALHSIEKPVIWFKIQIKWLVSIWNSSWIGSKDYLQYDITFSLNRCLWNIVP